MVRDGKEIQIKVNIGDLSPERAASTGDYENVLRDVQVQQLTDELRASLRVSERVSGVVVSGAPPATGLKRGDIIMELNRQALETVDDYNKAASMLESKADALLLIYREGGAFYLTISK